MKEEVRRLRTQLSALDLSKHMTSLSATRD